MSWNEAKAYAVWLTQQAGHQDPPRRRVTVLGPESRLGSWVINHPIASARVADEHEAISAGYEIAQGSK